MSRSDESDRASDAAVERKRCERWFVRRGLPHLIHDYSARSDVLTRAAPFLALVLFTETFLVFGDRWKGWGQAVVFGLGLSVAVAGVSLVNRLRGRRWFQLPDRVKGWEVVVYLGLPAVFAGAGSSGSVLADALSIAVLNALLFAVGYMITSWGLIPMIRWSLRHIGRQIGQMMTLLAKSLPILLLFSAFIFLNAEIWQVAHDFTLPYFSMVAILLSGIVTVFIALSVRRLAVDLEHFSAWSDVRGLCADTPAETLVPDDSQPPPNTPRLSRRARFNVSLLLFVSQIVQMILVALTVTAFYVVFGMITVRESTLAEWTEVETLTWENSWAVPISLLDAELLFSRQLLLVSAFIGLFSGMQFAVSVVFDTSYRSEFAEDLGEDVREALAVRAVYHRALVEPAA